MEDFIKIYIFEGDELSEPCLMPKWRREEIERAHPFEQRDKVLVWRALTIAIKDAFNEDLNELHPRKILTSKLVMDKYHVSLSHSGDRFMVGLSSQNIGVDIMKNSEYRYYSLIDNKSMWSDAEKKILFKKEDNIALYYETWTKKEALYKFLDPGFPFKENKNKVDTTKYPDLFKIGSLECEYHFFAIASELLKVGIVPEIKTSLEIDK